MFIFYVLPAQAGRAEIHPGPEIAGNRLALV
jgi:hypothetical protein